MSVSVVIPTFNEADNALALLARLNVSLHGLDGDVTFVDDGTDDLPEVVSQAADRVHFPVRVIRREVATGRLGGAVVEGMRQSRGDLVLVMDGDLQHPPELIPDLVTAAADVDLVVASRYRAGGDARGLSSGARRAVSRSTGLVSKTLFPARLRSVTDPMSGFFAIRRSVLELDALHPKGFKILLEILARSRPLRVAEVPFIFGARLAGESSASLREGFRFLRQLLTLRVANRAALFMLVGASGVLPNLAVLYALTGAGMHFLPASIIGVQCGVVWNFAGAEFLVWKDHRTGHWARRFVTFLAVAETDLIRIPFVIALVALFGGHSVIASALTLAAAFLLRFTLADKIVYRRRVTVPHMEVPHMEVPHRETAAVIEQTA